MKTLRETIAEAIYRHPNRDVADAYKIADDALATFREWMEKNGLAVVPREATIDMLERGTESDHIRHTWEALDVWRWMITAAPDTLGET